MNGSLLIVDDEEGIRQSLASYFKLLNYQVQTASCTDDAIKVLANVPVDVLISDIVMPHKNGVELLREVRKEYPMVKVIMITGYVTLENASP